MLKIRQANKFDVTYFVNLVHELAKAEHIMTYNHGGLDSQYLNQLFAGIIAGAGIAMIAQDTDKNKNIGMAIGIITPALWAPHILNMVQILLWTDEDYRKTKAGYMLLKTYEDKIEEFMKQERIRYSTICASEPLFNLDFSKFNYSMDEKVWIRGA
jgi:hypothetical protein